MVVVEPVVTEEKVRQLLAEGTESESLDFKETLDLDDLRDRIELVKDIGAMQILGGYIVVGADSGGRLTNLFTAAQAARFDEARVRDIVTKYLPEPIDLLVARHSIDGHPLVAIYVGSHRDCFAIFKTIGEYPKPKGTEQVFRPGEVFARHGTKSERWRQEDVDAIKRCIAAKEKESWRKELTDYFERVQAGTTGQRLAAGPAASFTWQLDDNAYYATAIELLRANDPIPIRLLLRSASGDAERLLARPDGEADFNTLLNRLACLAAIGEVTEARWVTEATIQSLGSIYDLGFQTGQASQERSIDAPRLWLAVLLRVYAIGALAVRESDWSTVRLLAIRPAEPPGPTQWFRSWIRHGLTMAARSRLFNRQEGGQSIELSLLSMAQEVIRDEPCLRPDAAPEDERLLDSLCQFDILASLVAISDAGSIDTRYFYTSFARFYTRRAQPAVSRLIRDQEMRQVLFPGTDEFLATALAEVNRLASRESFQYAGWDGFDDDAIVKFIRDHRQDG